MDYLFTNFHEQTGATLQFYVGKEKIFHKYFFFFLLIWLKPEALNLPELKLRYHED